MTHLQQAIKTSAQAKAVARDILNQLKKGAQTASMIGTAIRVDTATTARWLRLLREEGWAEKNALTGRRIILWAITAAGKQALEIL